MRIERLPVLLLLPVLMTLACAPARNQGAATIIPTGAGAHPLSSTVTALWLTGEERLGRFQPIVVVYYQGDEGWHDRAWRDEGSLDAIPSSIRLASGDLELSIEYRGPSDVRVQGTRVDLSASNVFLVRIGRDEAGSGVVPLGKVAFAVPAGAVPAEHVLSANPAIAAGLAESPGVPLRQ